MLTSLSLLRRRSRFAWATAIALLVALAARDRATAQPAPAAPPPNPQPQFTLSDCLRIANERQPALAAARASLAARLAANKGVNDLRVHKWLAPDLSIRRKQSCRGLDAAHAELFQAEFDTAYSVMRTYFTAVYARQQQDVADGVVNSLKLSQELVSNVVNDPNAGPDTKLNADTLAKLTIYLRLAQSKQSEATVGSERALAALREAMGYEADCGMIFYPADRQLPEPKIVPCKEQIIEMALCRRGELIQAQVAADVIRLEVDAQGKIRIRPKAATFAANGDIHAKSLPTGVRNGEYKPGAVGIEMPVSLGGSRDARMQQACNYANRADAVIAKTRGLITLEAEDAFFNWKDATTKVAGTRDAAKLGRELAERTKRNRGVGNIKEEDLLQNDVLAGMAQSGHNEALFHLILALANLERITAGGFNSGLAPETVISTGP